MTTELQNTYNKVYYNDYFILKVCVGIGQSHTSGCRLGDGGSQREVVANLSFAQGGTALSAIPDITVTSCSLTVIAMSFPLAHMCTH